MTEYLIDTNHLSVLVTDGHPLLNRIHRQIYLGDTFSITTVSLTEILFGLEMTKRAIKNLARWNEIEVIFRFYDIRRVDAQLSAKLQAELRKTGKQLHTVDALIAAITLRYDLTLLTTDSDFKPIPGLRTENWIAVIE